MGGTHVEFTNEGGQDAGGLTRDFFTELSKELFNQNYSLFRKSDNGSTYMPNSKSYVQVDHIGYFKFVGKVIAKAILDNCLLECFFVKSIYKSLVGQKLRFKDLEDFDHNLYVGLNWTLNTKKPADVEALYETFCIEEDYFGKPQMIDLIPGGSEIDVNYDNRELYVEKKAYYTLYKTVQRQIDAFL
jgi:E3 ubiquitin-protein ligase HUWE1